MIQSGNPLSEDILEKKISIATLIVSLILAMLLVFMLTFTILSDYYRGELANAYGAVTENENTIDADISSDASENTAAYIAKLKLIQSIFKSRSYFDIDTDAAFDLSLAGFCSGTGDKYAQYYNEENFAIMTEDSDGEMQGIGINIIYNADYGIIEVINVMPDSPALEAGVQPGDFIVTVGIGKDAENVAELGYYPAVAKLQGKAGTLCEFTVARGKNHDELIEFSVERDHVTEQTVRAHLYEKDNTIGIIKILEFDGGTVAQFVDAVNSLQAAGATRFVFDVRYNPGGDLQAICSILDALLPEGPIIRIKDKSGEETSIDSDAFALDFPMVVLCNGSTASAAELFTSALKDYKKATIVGTVTYGKGSMQSIVPLGDGTAIKLTTKMYFPPFSESYEGVGITPDIEVEMDESLANINIYKITDEQDTQLQRAIAHLNN